MSDSDSDSSSSEGERERRHEMSSEMKEIMPSTKQVDVLRKVTNSSTWFTDTQLLAASHHWDRERLPAFIKATRCLNDAIYDAVEIQLVDRKIDQLSWDELKTLISKIYGIERRETTPETVADSLIELFKAYQTRNCQDEHWAQAALLKHVAKLTKMYIPGDTEGEKLKSIESWNDNFAKAILVSLSPDCVIEKVRKIALKEQNNDGAALAEAIKSNANITMTIKESKANHKRKAEQQVSKETSSSLQRITARSETTKSTLPFVFPLWIS